MQAPRKLIGLAAATAIAVAGCGSSSHTGSSPTTSTGSGSSVTTVGGGSGKTISVGLLVDETGLAASGNKTAASGAQAGIIQAAKDGYTIKLYTADTATSTATALSAAQKLVQQDHVEVVFSQSSLMFAAAPWLKSHNIPVIGAAEDSTEWLTDTNMFGVTGPIHPTLVNTDYGQIFKMLGATNVASVGYSISPISADSAKGVAPSAKAVGIKAGYVNANFPFGSTNVAPDALAMKAAGVNGFTGSTDPNTEFAFIQQLRTDGVDLKAVVLPTGYGGDLTQAGTDAEQVAKGVTFLVGFEPIELHTAATEQITADLKAAGVTTEPTYAEYEGYADVALLVQALPAAGSNPTSASILTALSGVNSFDAWGLLGSHPVDVNNRTASGNDNCEYYATWNGTSFQMITGAEPLCGTVVQQ